MINAFIVCIESTERYAHYWTLGSCSLYDSISGRKIPKKHSDYVMSNFLNFEKRKPAFTPLDALKINLDNHP